jgi:hypothetical protein
MKKPLILILAILIGILLFLKFGLCPEKGVCPSFGGPAVDGIRNIVRSFSFNDKSAFDGWQEKVFKGKVAYTLEDVNSEGTVVKAESNNAASAMYYNQKMEIKKFPEISWKWKVEQFPKRTKDEAIEEKDEGDFAARIYVIFEAAFFPQTKVIEYIWAETLPEGHIGTSPFSDKIKVLVLRSGASDGKWFTETRDICDDFVMLFGEAPKKNVKAISFMTDADSTKTKAVCFYDDIKLGYRQEKGE